MKPYEREFNLFLSQIRLSHLLRFLFTYVCIMKMRKQNVYIDSHLASNNQLVLVRSACERNGVE